MDSPCVKLCVYDARCGICAGCGRSLEEIANWSDLSDAERHAVLAQLPARLAAIKHPPAS